MGSGINSGRSTAVSTKATNQVFKTPLLNKAMRQGYVPNEAEMSQPKLEHSPPKLQVIRVLGNGAFGK